jgi:hypothetical protein
MNGCLNEHNCCLASGKHADRYRYYTVRTTENGLTKAMLLIKSMPSSQAS